MAALIKFGYLIRHVFVCIWCSWQNYWPKSCRQVISKNLEVRWIQYEAKMLVMVVTEQMITNWWCPSVCLTIHFPASPPANTFVNLLSTVVFDYYIKIKVRHSPVDLGHALSNITITADLDVQPLHGHLQGPLANDTVITDSSWF